MQWYVWHASTEKRAAGRPFVALSTSDGNVVDIDDAILILIHAYVEHLPRRHLERRGLAHADQIEERRPHVVDDVLPCLLPRRLLQAQAVVGILVAVRLLLPQEGVEADGPNPNPNPNTNANTNTNANP